MPLSAEHKQKSRETIIEAARVLFNRHGFERVSIDDIMKAAGLTRGGFYNHFKSKDALYAEAVNSFLMGRGAQWRKEAGIDTNALRPEMARQMIMSYLSEEHLGDLDAQCPMIALPTDVARANEEVQKAYQKLLQSMSWLLEQSMGPREDRRQDVLSIMALSIGGMVIARALPDDDLATDVRKAALTTALELLE